MFQREPERDLEVPGLAHMIGWNAEKDFSSGRDNPENLRSWLITIVVAMRTLRTIVLAGTLGCALRSSFRTPYFCFVHIGGDKNIGQVLLPELVAYPRAF